MNQTYYNINESYNNQNIQSQNTKLKQPKQIGDFIIGKVIGQGTFGKVRIGIHKYTNQKVAIKFLQKKKITQISDVQRVSRQIHILKLIRHPNLIQLYQIIQTPKQLLLIMEYIENGELFDYIVKNGRINQGEAKRMFHEIINGIEYMHKIGITHRDLKPENILLDYNNRLKIVDFGLSNIYKQGQKLKTPCGSPCYAAPQMIKGQKYQGKKIDIWSSGIILFAMLCGYLPFQDQNISILYKKILDGDYKFHKKISESAKDLIRKILNNNVDERYTIQEIRKHQWMTIENDVNNYRFTEGIIVGYNKIPVDRQVLRQTLKYLPNNLSPSKYSQKISRFQNIDYIQKCLQANRHNQQTVMYYLTLKKFIKNGGDSKYDMGSDKFDKRLIQPSKRQSGQGKNNMNLNLSMNLMNKQKQNNINNQNRTNNQILIDNFITKSSNQSNNNNQSKQRHHNNKSKNKNNIESQMTDSIEIPQSLYNFNKQKQSQNNDHSYSYSRIQKRNKRLKALSKSKQKQNQFENSFTYNNITKRKSKSKQKCSSKQKQKERSKQRSKQKQRSQRQSRNNSKIKDNNKSNIIKSGDQKISNLYLTNLTNNYNNITIISNNKNGKNQKIKENEKSSSKQYSLNNNLNISVNCGNHNTKKIRSITSTNLNTQNNKLDISSFILTNSQKSKQRNKKINSEKQSNNININVDKDKDNKYFNKSMTKSNNIIVYSKKDKNNNKNQKNYQLQNSLQPQNQQQENTTKISINNISTILTSQNGVKLIKSIQPNKYQQQLQEQFSKQQTNNYNKNNRFSLIENRINRKYKEKFNQSIVSKSKLKCKSKEKSMDKDIIRDNGKKDKNLMISNQKTNNIKQSLLYNNISNLSTINNNHSQYGNQNKTKNSIIYKNYNTSIILSGNNNKQNCQSGFVQQYLNKAKRGRQTQTNINNKDKYKGMNKQNININNVNNINSQAPNVQMNKKSVNMNINNNKNKMLNSSILEANAKFTSLSYSTLKNKKVL